MPDLAALVIFAVLIATSVVVLGGVDGRPSTGRLCAVRWGGRLLRLGSAPLPALLLAGGAFGLAALCIEQPAILRWLLLALIVATAAQDLRLLFERLMPPSGASKHGPQALPADDGAAQHLEGPLLGAPVHAGRVGIAQQSLER